MDINARFPYVYSKNGVPAWRHEDVMLLIFPGEKCHQSRMLLSVLC